MPLVSASRRPSRLFAALVALYYVCVSVLLPLQHHHGLFPAEEMRLSPSAVASTVDNAAPIPLRVHIAANPATSHPDRCLACEWLAIHVSPAMPVFTLTLVLPSAPRVPAMLTRVLPARPLSLSSRGPPLA